MNARSVIPSEMLTDYYFNFAAELKYNFAAKKIQSVDLAKCYRRIGLSQRSSNVYYCAQKLFFSQGAPDERVNLLEAKFCRDRLCPMCAARRSLKIFSQVSQIMSHLGDSYRFIFLTLTVPNVSGLELESQLDELQRCFKSFMSRKRIKDAVKGYIKVLEVTYNKTSKTFHPHYHVIIAVDDKYFDRNYDYYISRDEYLLIWCKCTGMGYHTYKNVKFRGAYDLSSYVFPDAAVDFVTPTLHYEFYDDYTLSCYTASGFESWRTRTSDYITQVDVRAVRDRDTRRSISNYSAIAEIAKYTVKSIDYIYCESKKEQDTIVKTLADALGSNRRMISFGGCFADARSELALDDPEDGDLVHVNDVPEAAEGLVYSYSWYKNCYRLTGIYSAEVFRQMKEEAAQYEYECRATIISQCLAQPPCVT